MDDPDRFPLGDFIGLQLRTPAPGEAVAQVEVTERLHNPHGALHGAVVFAMVDTAMGAATMSVLDEGQRCASIDVHVRYLRPVLSGTVEATVRVVHAGRSIVNLAAEVTADGRLVATATGSFAVIAGG